MQGKGKAAPLQAWSGPESSRKLRFPDYMTTAQDSVKFVSLSHRPPLPPGNSPGIHFCYRLSRPKGHSAIGRILCQRKVPLIPARNEPATFRFVAQLPLSPMRQGGKIKGKVLVHAIFREGSHFGLVINIGVVRRDYWQIERDWSESVWSCDIYKEG